MVIFIDEFQQIAILPQHQTIEASLRSVAQELEMVTLIFSGSNRKLLLMMFDDRKRPFFQLCEKIFLERISKNDYVKHLQKLAQKRWKNFLSDNASELIFELSQNHPYYLNLLCSKLWNISKLPDSRTVKLCWQYCLQEETHLLSQALISLSTTQRAFLLLILEEKIDQPGGKKVANSLNVTPRAVIKAVNSLIDNDYIFKDDGGYYQLINPLLKDYMEKQKRFVSSTSRS